MNTSIKDYHRIPTYDELIQEAVIHPTETIKYPNRIATQLRNTPQLTRFDDESFLDMSTINSNAMKQNLQQTAVQRALQPAAHSIPTGVQQFDMADTEEAIQEQVDERAEGYERYKEQQSKKQKTLVSISEEELRAPSQIYDMMASSSAAASSSSASASCYISDTAIVPVRPRTQSYEEQTSRNLRGSTEVPRWGGHRRTQSSASVDSTASTAASAIEVIPAHIQQSTDIDILLEAARYRRSELINRGTVADHQLAMEMKTIALGIEKLRSGGSESKTREAVKLYTTLKKRLIQILETPL